MENTDAYRIIDEADKRSNLFRFVISPDPAAEDNEKDINMREITQATMLKIEEMLGKTVLWTAAIHEEHTDKRHIHALAIVPGRLNKPHLQLLIHEATKACLVQRQELDRVLTLRTQEKEKEKEEEWERER